MALLIGKKPWKHYHLLIQVMGWEDNLSEWTGLGLGEALRKAEDREGWRKVVARLSLMPSQSFRLRDE